MLTTREIIKRFRNKDLAAELGVAPSTVTKWQDRGIPGIYWIAIASFAAAHGENWITLDVLANMHAKRAPEPPETRV